MARGARRRVREQLPDVAHLRRERGGALVLQEPAELLQVGAAAGRVDDDEVDVVVERGDQRTGERLSLFESPGVDGQGSAATLRRGDDLVAVGGEHAGRGCVHVREHCALDTAREQADASASGAGGGSQPCDLAAPSPARRDLDERPEAPGRRRVLPERG
jgi:hypothetical protein